MKVPDCLWAYIAYYIIDVIDDEKFFSQLENDLSMTYYVIRKENLDFKDYMLLTFTQRDLDYTAKN